MSTGAVKVLNPGDLVWDYSMERPSDATLRNAGVKGVSRYLSLINSLTTAKIITYDEVHHLADLGIATMLNYEWTPDGPTKGAARGVSDAQWTNRFRHESGAWGKPLDWPDDVPVVVSLDTGVDTATLNGPVTEYFQAFKDTYTGDVIGSYQGIFLHRRLQAVGISNGPFWTAGGAWSWSGSPQAVDDPPTQIVQRVSGVGGHNDLLVPVPFWDPNGDPPLPPQSLGLTEEVMLVYNTEVYPQFKEAADAGYVPPAGGWPVGWVWWEIIPQGGKRWVSGEDYQARYDWAILNGVKGLGRTTGQLQSIPDYVPATADLAPVLAAEDETQAAVAAVTGAVSALAAQVAAKPTDADVQKIANAVVAAFPDANTEAVVEAVKQAFREGTDPR